MKKAILAVFIVLISINVKSQDKDIKNTVSLESQWIGRALQAHTELLAIQSQLNKGSPTYICKARMEYAYKMYLDVKNRKDLYIERETEIEVFNLVIAGTTREDPLVFSYTYSDKKLVSFTIEHLPRNSKVVLMVENLSALAVIEGTCAFLFYPREPFNNTVLDVEFVLPKSTKENKNDK